MRNNHSYSVKPFGPVFWATFACSLCVWILFSSLLLARIESTELAALCAATLSIPVFLVIYLLSKHREGATRNDGAPDPDPHSVPNQAPAASDDARMAAITETMVDAVVSIDSQGKILFANTATERMFGYDKPTLIGKNIKILMPRDQAGHHDAAMAQYLRTGESAVVGISREAVAVRADGEEFPIDLSVSEAEVNGQKLFTGVMRDITTRQLFAAKAREAEERLADAIEALPDGFVLYDKNDRLVLCNSKYREIYETSAKYIVEGQTFEEIIRAGAAAGQYSQAKDDLEAWVAERLEQHQNPSGIVEQRLDSGRWLRIIERKTDDGRIVGFRVDVTELKEREEALKRSEDQLRATIEAALDGIIVIDDAGTVLDFNSGAESIFGYSKAEMLGKTMADLIIPERYRDGHTAGMNHFNRTGEGPILGQRVEIEGLRADGVEILCELAVQAVSSPSGSRFIGFIRDITEIKAQADALIEAKERAEVANVAKARFLAVISHEIRTPLNGVLGMLNLLQDDELSEVHENYVKTARESGKALLTIINDILDFAKLEAGKMELEEVVFDIRTLIASIRDLLAPRAEDDGNAIHILVDDDVARTVSGDSGRVRQILLNLVSNSVKFTKNGSITVRVAAALDGADEQLVKFAVEDTGIGIPLDRQGDLFADFTTVDPSYTRKFGGTGLGLAISRELTALLGGELGFESAEGQGSTFWFTVPLRRSRDVPPAETRPDEGAVRSIDLTGTRVLLAEDNATNQLVVSDMLERLGCAVDVAGDGREAVEAFTRQDYDIVFMDISMPEMDGVEASRTIRQIEPEGHYTPIIALTAFVFSEERADFLDAGMDDVLPKPLAREQLMGALHDFLPKKQKTATRGSRPGIPEALFDFDILETLWRDASPGLRQKLSAQIIEDLERHGQLVTDAMKTGDALAIARSAHVLKSVAATFGALHLEQQATAVDRAHRDGNDPDVLAGGDTLVRRIETVLADLPDVIARLNAQVNEETSAVADNG